MTNQDEWFYREPSDPPDPGPAPAHPPGDWIYREPSDPRSQRPQGEPRTRGNRASPDWERENDGTGQRDSDPWAASVPRRPPPSAYHEYNNSAPARADHTRWDMPATRDYQPTVTRNRPQVTGNRPQLPANRPRPQENRPYAQDQYPPGRVSQEPATSIRLWGVVGLAAALGLLLDSYSVAQAPTHYALASALLWPAAVLPNVAFAAVLLSRRLSTALRHFTIAMVGVYSALIYRASSPLVMSSFDEHLHDRTLSDLLLGSGLFAPNPLLDVSPNYPGMELFTGTAIRLLDLPMVVGSSLVVLLFRYLLVLAIYECARTVNASPRFASLVVLLYATSPQFFFFNSIFAYQSVAVPLGLGGLLLVRRAQLAGGPAGKRLVAAGIVALAATVVTHHITSWFVFAFLLGWTVLTPRARRRQLTIASVGMGLALLVWTAAIFTKMLSYLGPILVESVQQAISVVSGSSSQRQVLGGSSGYVTPEWQKFVLIVYALAYTGAAVVFGFILLKRAFGGRGRVLGLVGLATLCYPISLAMHFLPNAASIGDRASTFLFLPLSLAAALVLVQDPRVVSVRRLQRRTPGARVNPRLYGIFALLIGFAYMGGVFLGAGPDWDLLPGPYLVVGDSRSQDPNTLAAIKWAAAHVPPGSRVIADRDSGDLLAGEARLWPLLGPQNGIDYASIYFAPQWSSYQTNLLRELHVGYLYVDDRLSESLPQEGYYIYQGETATPVRLTSQDLSKFARVSGLKAVYKNGPISIYSTAGLGVTPETTGYSGYRGMGFGIVGDTIFGAAVVLVLYALRRRLRWIVDLFRDAGPVGGIAAVAGAVIFIGFPLFGFDIEPGPGFSIGAGLTALVLIAVSRRRAGKSLLPVPSRRFRVDPVFVVAMLITALAIGIDLRSAWILDVVDVNNILHGIR
jgi:hypothetical protein